MCVGCLKLSEFTGKGRDHIPCPLAASPWFNIPKGYCKRCAVCLLIIHTGADQLGNYKQALQVLYYPRLLRGDFETLCPSVTHILYQYAKCKWYRALNNLRGKRIISIYIPGLEIGYLKFRVGFHCNGIREDSQDILRYLHPIDGPCKLGAYLVEFTIRGSPSCRRLGGYKPLNYCLLTGSDNPCTIYSSNTAYLGRLNKEKTRCICDGTIPCLLLKCQRRRKISNTRITLVIGYFQCCEETNPLQCQLLHYLYLDV